MFDVPDKLVSRELQALIHVELRHVDPDEHRAAADAALLGRVLRRRLLVPRPGRRHRGLGRRALFAYWHDGVGGSASHAAVGHCPFISGTSATHTQYAN